MLRDPPRSTRHLNPSHPIWPLTPFLLPLSSFTFTFLPAPEFQRLYTPTAFREDRVHWRAIIQLNLIRSIHAILAALAASRDLLSQSPRTRARTIDSGWDESSDLYSTLGGGGPPSLPLSYSYSSSSDDDRADDELDALALRLLPLRHAEQYLKARLVPPDEDEAVDLGLTQPGGLAKEIFVRPGRWRASVLGCPTRLSEIGGAEDDEPQRVLHACRREMMALWASQRVKEVLAFKRVRLEEESGFFLNDLERLTSDDYMPTDGQSPPSQPRRAAGETQDDRRLGVQVRDGSGPVERHGMAARGCRRFEVPSASLPPPLSSLVHSVNEQTPRLTDDPCSDVSGTDNAFPCPSTRAYVDLVGFLLNNTTATWVPFFDNGASPHSPSKNIIIIKRQLNVLAFFFFVLWVGGGAVDAIIFLAPISAFDQVLTEDLKVNRLVRPLALFFPEDSVLLWKAVCSNKLLAHVDLVVFLNKCDILARKLDAGVRLAKYVRSYGERSNDMDTASKYFRSKFSAIQRVYSPLPRKFYGFCTSVTVRPPHPTLSIASPPPLFIPVRSLLTLVWQKGHGHDRGHPRQRPRHRHPTASPAVQARIAPLSHVISSPHKSFSPNPTPPPPKIYALSPIHAHDPGVARTSLSTADPDSSPPTTPPPARALVDADAIYNTRVRAFAYSRRGVMLVRQKLAHPLSSPRTHFFYPTIRRYDKYDTAVRSEGFSCVTPFLFFFFFFLFLCLFIVIPSYPHHCSYLLSFPFVCYAPMRSRFS
ncbi:hypothetical protein EW146_g9848 [Bondarzewia mesenterica]|uniref:Uncharacterized protein n=1 Tax=Bondarzewia mesenterica TaxID=1095465 RepID=A0A4S4L4L4_9AGAM|nr:hypothetical protein EW146_g9848 [Bondarzewia mesenterica]